MRREYGENARERAVKLFSKDVFCKNVKNLLSDLAGAAKSEAGENEAGE